MSDNAAQDTKPKLPPPFRYAQHCFAWWCHDALVHPITGTLGLLGRLLNSRRLMAIGHHLHNSTAPSNDATADYLAAAARAGHNETAGNPYSSREQVDAYYDQASKILGRDPKNWQEAVHACRGTPVAESTMDGSYRAPIQIVDRVTAEKIELQDAELALARFEAKSAAEHLGCGEHGARQLLKSFQLGNTEPKIEAVRAEHERLLRAAEAARKKDEKLLTLGQLLKVAKDQP